MIYIDQDVKKFIQSTNKKYLDIEKSRQQQKTTGDPEFEIRVSNKDGHMSPELFYKLIEKCRLQKNSEKNSESTVNIYEQFREIKTGEEIIYQLKNGKESLDKEYSKYKLRYSYSLETNLQKVSNPGKILMSRHRNRIEFDTSKGYIYVFTEVVQSEKDKKKKLYEFEIEFDLSKLTTELIDDSLEILTDYSKSNIESKKSREILQQTNFKIPQPINISEKDYSVLKENVYQVTNKLDGHRFLLYFSDEMYSIQNQNVNHIGPNLSNKVCLLDTEFFKDNYYIFDCYVYDGHDVSKELLSNRLKYAEEICKTNPLLKMKLFKKELYSYTEELLESLNKDENDGLIYTPEDPTKKLPIFKWKFPEKMSIDFRVKQLDSDSPTYKLCVYTDTDKEGNTPFKINKENALYSGSELKENGIYEFIYQGGKFIMTRERSDKELPNFIVIASNVWRDIVHPFESFRLVRMLGPLYKFRKYHNTIKKDLIEEYCKNKRVLDLGVGRGGDLSKYEKVHAKVYGVEPYELNYTELEKRISESATVFDFTLIKTAGQNTKQIIKEINANNEGVDIISSFFSLSFFFFPSKPEDLKNLVQTISQSLNEDGYFIGTTIDGQKTIDLLNQLPEKKFNFGDGFIQLNSDKTVTFEVKGTIVDSQLESLVDFDRLVDELKLVGIELEDSNFFKTNKELNKDENTLNSLYRTFVFKKNHLMIEIENLCSKNSIPDLMVKTKNPKCIELFKEYLKEIENLDVFEIEPENHYEVMKEFYKMKFVNRIQSTSLLKAYTLFGDRLNKIYVREKIPTTSQKIREYKKTENYAIIVDQLEKTILELHKNGIDYGNLLDGLMVDEKRLIFSDYSKLLLNQKKFKDDDDIKQILDFLVI